MITNTIDLSNVTMPYTTGNVPTNVSGQKGMIYVINMSDICFNLNFGGTAQNGHIPSWWARPFCVASTTAALNFTSVLMPAGYQEPIGNHLAIETYLAGEDTSHLRDTPISISQGPTNVTTASVLANNGNTAPTLVASTQVAGDPNQTMNLYNNGQLFLGDNMFSGVVGVSGASAGFHIDANNTPAGFYQNDNTGTLQMLMYLNASNLLTLVSPGMTYNLNGNINLNVTSGHTINGGTSGTATLLQDDIGTFKRIIIFLNNFRTGGAAQNIAIPSAFTKGAHITTGGIGTSVNAGGVSCLASGVAQTVFTPTTFASTGNTATGVTILYQYAFGECFSAFDTVQFPASSTSAHTAFIIMTGE